MSALHTKGGVKHVSMGMHRFREEVINTQLAAILAARGLDANAETIRGRARPDVLIDLEGLKLVIEGRTRTQATSLMEDARARVEEGIADIAIGLAYPRGLEEARTMAELRENIGAARYDGSIFHIGATGVVTDLFRDASIDEITQMINSAFSLRIRNDVVSEQVRKLNATLDTVVAHASMSNLFASSDVLVARLQHVLGVDPDGEETDRSDDD